MVQKLKFKNKTARNDVKDDYREARCPARWSLVSNCIQGVCKLITKTFEDRKLGAHLGSLYCGIPTVADDVTLVSNELQVMLNVQSSFANKQRVIISSKKYCVLQNGCDKDQRWTINDDTLQTPKSAPDLGIQRDNC